MDTLLQGRDQGADSSPLSGHKQSWNKADQLTVNKQAIIFRTD